MTEKQTIAPCLWFERDALGAAEFYVKMLGGKIDAVHRSRVDNPSAKEGQILFVEFTLRGQRYQALNGGRYDAFNDSISLSVTCEDQPEVDRLWSALTADGGRPVKCGWLKDKYGLSWQIVPRQMLAFLGDPDPARAKRAFEAMMQMEKLDIAKLQAAADAA